MDGVHSKNRTNQNRNYVRAMIFVNVVVASTVTTTMKHIIKGGSQKDVPGLKLRQGKFVLTRV